MNIPPSVSKKAVNPLRNGRGRQGYLKLVFVLFDSLNRLALENYGGPKGDTPNFERFAKRSVTFDKHYVGSLPCMPARRDLHTGRLNMMHRSWGPLEPYDNSFAQMLDRSGTHSRLITDHYHYFEDGGAGYHTRYSSWDMIRGQEYDSWKVLLDPPTDKFKKKFSPEHYDFDRKSWKARHAVNLEFMQEEAELPGPKCFESAFEFLDHNRDADDWFLQVETFDPHEPFHAPEKYRRAGDSDYEGGVLNWPSYAPVDESASDIAEIRANYVALVRMCDAYFGRLLDYFDEHDLWKDTALIMSTDHGFLLSEHQWWGKCRMPYYEEIAHIPMMFYHPDLADKAGTRCDQLTQTPDIMPTILDCFGVENPPETLGTSLLDLMQSAPEDREVLFGIFGGAIGVTDGRYVMFHYPPDTTDDGLYEYTLNPQHMTAPFTNKELLTAELAPGFDFTKGLPLLKIEAQKDAKRVPMNDGLGFDEAEFALFDLATDPGQNTKIRDQKVETRLYAAMLKHLAELDTPTEAYDWYGLRNPTEITASVEA